MPNEGREYKVVITETAWEQLIEHARFLANVSMSAANRLVDGFVEAADTLKYMPERCAWLENDAIPFQKYRKLLFGKRCMLLFQIRGDTVYVSAAVDCRQDYGWLL